MESDGDIIRKTESGSLAAANEGPAPAEGGWTRPAPAARGPRGPADPRRRDPPGRPFPRPDTVPVLQGIERYRGGRPSDGVQEGQGGGGEGEGEGHGACS